MIKKISCSMFTLSRIQILNHKWISASNNFQSTNKIKVNINKFSSVQSVLSNSLRPEGLQHARPTCPLPTPGVYSNSCPLSRWCHSIISSSVVPFSCPQSFPESGSFGCKVGSSHKVAKELELRLQQQALQWKFRVDFLSYTDTVWRNYSLLSHNVFMTLSNLNCLPSFWWLS